MSIGANTLNTELNRGHATFMRQLAAMWVWVRDLEKQNERAKNQKEVNSNERKDRI